MLISGTVQEANNGSDHAASSECNRDEKHLLRKARVRKPTFTPVMAFTDLGSQRSCDVAACWTTREWVCPAETAQSRPPAHGSDAAIAARIADIRAECSKFTWAMTESRTKQTLR